ncbi:MAG TPA: hypothetical protein VNW04_08905 [Puia sp.]|jgi:hypothetical protein|nr:hypothetical protein [Puia sp.]
MIHAKELRYGNKVQTRDGETITVQQILGNSLIYDTQIKVNREVAAVRGSLRTAYASQFIEVVKEADFQEIEPIALTPKVLEKCGFRNFIREEWILSVGNTHVDFTFTDEGLKLRQSTPGAVSIKYLHQLQNFLFSILGYDLESGL